VVLATPKIYDVTSDPGETTSIETKSKAYGEVLTAVQKAIEHHIHSLEPVENQFTWQKVMPNIHWQPCCNGTFPFNCNCVDPKYANSLL